MDSTKTERLRDALCELLGIGGRGTRTEREMDEVVDAIANLASVESAVTASEKTPREWAAVAMCEDVLGTTAEVSARPRLEQRIEEVVRRAVLAERGSCALALMRRASKTEDPRAFVLLAFGDPKSLIAHE